MTLLPPPSAHRESADNSGEWNGDDVDEKYLWRWTKCDGGNKRSRFRVYLWFPFEDYYPKETTHGKNKDRGWHSTLRRSLSIYFAFHLRKVSLVYLLFIGLISVEDESLLRWLGSSLLLRLPSPSPLLIPDSTSTLLCWWYPKTVSCGATDPNGCFWSWNWVLLVVIWKRQTEVGSSDMKLKQ